MPSVKLSISLDTATADLLRHRSRLAGKPTSRYLSELVRDDDRRCRDALAEEGYRLLSADTTDFADAALPLAAETWPEWIDAQPPDGPKATPKGGPCKLCPDTDH
jgi:hypothetical protein